MRHSVLKKGNVIYFTAVCCNNYRSTMYALFNQIDAYKYTNYKKKVCG